MGSMARRDFLTDVARVCGVVALVAGCSRAGLAQVATRGAGRQLWQVSAKDDIVPALQDLELTSFGAAGAAATQAASLEIRSSDNARRVAVIPAMVAAARRSASPTMPPVTMNLATYPNIPSVPAGEYVAAWVADGQRRSNVIHLTVDPKKDLAKLPRVRIVQLEPEKPGGLPTVMAYVSRAQQSDPAPDRMMLANSSLVVDGVFAGPGSGGFEGSNPTLAVGGTMIASTHWRTAPDLTKPHTIAVRVGNGPLVPSQRLVEPKPGEYQDSDTVPLEVGTPRADAWDKATSALAPAPAGK